MEIKLFFVTIGMILMMCAFGLGVVIGGLDKRKHNRDRGGNNYNNVAGGDNRRVDRRDYTQEVTDIADKLGLKIGG